MGATNVLQPLEVWSCHVCTDCCGEYRVLEQIAKGRKPNPLALTGPACTCKPNRPWDTTRVIPVKGHSGRKDGGR